MTTLRQISCYFIFVLLLTACRQQSLSSSELSLDVSVDGMLVGPAQISVSVRDKNGAPVENPGALALRGDMDHAGMAPVFAEASEATDGVFTLPFEWTMAGAWILEAKLTLDSGEGLLQSFRYEIHAPAGDQEMSNMNHDEGHSGGEQRALAGSGHGTAMGEASAVYMQIDNGGDSALVIAAAKSSAAHLVEFHRSVIDKDIARMEKVETLVIPAGGRLELRPGGLHIMLRQLKTDLKPGSSIGLQLELASGEMIQLSIPILDMPMAGDQASTVLGDLVFSKLWARPASGGGVLDHAMATDMSASSK